MNDTPSPPIEKVSGYLIRFNGTIFVEADLKRARETAAAVQALDDAAHELKELCAEHGILIETGEVMPGKILAEPYEAAKKIAKETLQAPRIPLGKDADNDGEAVQT